MARGRPPRTRSRNTRMDAAVDAMAEMGFPEELIRETMSDLYELYGGSDLSWHPIEENGYHVLFEELIDRNKSKSVAGSRDGNLLQVASGPSNGNVDGAVDNAASDIPKTSGVAEPCSATVPTESNRNRTMIVDGAGPAGDPKESDIVEPSSAAEPPLFIPNTAWTENTNNGTMIAYGAGDPDVPHIAEPSIAAERISAISNTARTESREREKSPLPAGAGAESEGNRFHQSNGQTGGAGRNEVLVPIISSPRALLPPPPRRHPPPPAVNGLPTRTRKPCYGWITNDDQDVEFICLRPAVNRTSPAPPKKSESGKRKTRWDLAPDD